jgi:dihydroorotase
MNGPTPDWGYRMLNRRDFSKLIVASGSGVVSLGRSSPYYALRQEPDITDTTRFDLLVKGGTVIDPGRKIHAALDVAVKDGKIADVAPNILSSRASRIISAEGRIVTPGLIDLQVHCFEGMSNLAVDPDHYCLGRGTTTILSNGDAGHLNIDGFVDYIVKPSTTRIFTSVNIFSMGVIRPGLLSSIDSPAAMNVNLTADAVLRNKPAVVGIKAYIEKAHVESNDVECLKKALRAAELAGVPVVADIVDTYSPVATLVKMLRKGDVFTHAYNAFPNGILDANGRVLPEVLEARDRGVLFDTAQGEDKFDFAVAQKCFQQGLFPDSISSDLYAGNVDQMVFDLPTTLSKFLALGLTLDQVIERATFRPSKMFDFGLKIGTLAPGSEADISVFELQHGKYEFVGSKPSDKRTGETLLVNKAVICRGRYFVNAV